MQPVPSLSVRQPVELHLAADADQDSSNSGYCLDDQKGPCQPTRCFMLSALGARTVCLRNMRKNVAGLRSQSHTTHACGLDCVNLSELNECLVYFLL